MYNSQTFSLAAIGGDIALHVKNAGIQPLYYCKITQRDRQLNNGFFCALPPGAYCLSQQDIKSNWEVRFEERAEDKGRLIGYT